MPEESEQISFSSTLPIIVLSRPVGDRDWVEVDRGPGYFWVDTDLEIGVKIKGIDDATLSILVDELLPIQTLRFLDLAENRNVTNAGMEKLKYLTQLTELNLSSVSVSNRGFQALKDLVRLERLNLSYCNRLSDDALKTVEAMRSLEFVNLQGCPGITNGGLSRIRKKNLTINR